MKKLKVDKYGNIKSPKEKALKDMRSYDAVRKWKETGRKPRGLKKVL